MRQAVPKHIKEKNPELLKKYFYTLLIDGSNLLELSSLGDKTLSSSGKQIGGIFQFFLQISMLLKKGNFRYVYVFWDGENSGQLRWNLNSEYKANRDKNYESDGMSEYMKQVNSKINFMKNKFYKKEDPVKLAQKQKDKDIFYWQRDIIIQCLEELFIRQCLSDYTEADDFIGYYVTHKKDNEKIVIVSNDRDLTQLIDDDVIIYIQSLKKFVNKKNHKEIMGYDYRNVVLKKMICGDTSDNIKGIKGVGEKTLFDNFPEFKTRKVELSEVIDGAKKINEERERNKKKELKWTHNIVNKITDGVQGENIYEINKAIIDLKHPLMTDESKSLLEDMMYSPIDPEDRSLDNLYKILLDNDVDKLSDPSVFSSFFSDFMYIIDKEKKNSEN